MWLKQKLECSLEFNPGAPTLGESIPFGIGGFEPHWSHFYSHVCEEVIMFRHENGQLFCITDNGVDIYINPMQIAYAEFKKVDE